MGLFVFPQRGMGDKYNSLTYAAGSRLAVGARIPVHRSPGRRNYAIQQQHSLDRYRSASVSNLHSLLLYRFGLGLLWRFDGRDEIRHGFACPSMMIVQVRDQAVDRIRLPADRAAHAFSARTSPFPFWRKLYDPISGMGTRATFGWSRVLLRRNVPKLQPRRLYPGHQSAGTNSIGACAEYQMALARKEDAETTKLLQGLKESAKKELLAHPNPF